MRLDLLSGARQDLAALRPLNPDAYATVVAFLEEADADEELIDKCTSEGTVTIGPYRVGAKPWHAARRADDNLFRFRVFDTPATVYRIVCGFDWRAQRIGILAVVHKDNFDYDISSGLANRIHDDWRRATDGRAT
jgi:hypothetical protein